MPQIDFTQWTVEQFLAILAAQADNPTDPDTLAATHIISAAIKRFTSRYEEIDTNPAQMKIYHPTTEEFMASQEIDPAELECSEEESRDFVAQHNSLFFDERELEDLVPEPEYCEPDDEGQILEGTRLPDAEKASNESGANDHPRPKEEIKGNESDSQQTASPEPNPLSGTQTNLLFETECDQEKLQFD